jgi:hypothetical protein
MFPGPGGGTKLRFDYADQYYEKSDGMINYFAIYEKPYSRPVF